MSRAGFVTSRILFGNRWKFGRLTEGTIQGRKKKINRQVSTFKIEQKKKKIVTNREKF